MVILEEFSKKKRAALNLEEEEENAELGYLGARIKENKHLQSLESGWLLLC